MNPIYKGTLATFILSLGLLSNAFGAEYEIDASHSTVAFSVRHLVGKVPGHFKEFEGKFDFDEKSTDAAKVDFAVKTESISTNNEKRDTHLKGADFFDVKKYPTMSFKSKKLKSTGDRKFKLEGDLTIHGVTKPVSFDVEFNGIGADPWGNQRAGFAATTKVNRKDFGMNWNKALDNGGVLIGEEVTVNLEIEAIQKAAGTLAEKSVDKTTEKKKSKK